MCGKCLVLRAGWCLSKLLQGAYAMYLDCMPTYFFSIRGVRFLNAIKFCVCVCVVNVFLYINGSAVEDCCVYQLL